MDHVFEKYSAKQGACSAGFDELAQESFWVCNRSAVNWTWVRERPDFGPKVQRFENNNEVGVFGASPTPTAWWAWAAS